MTAPSNFSHAVRAQARPVPATTRRRRLVCEPLEARDVPSSVSGTMFEDANGNAVLDAGEAGLSGWTAFIDNDRDGVLDPGEVSTQTDAAGHYFIDTTAIPLFGGSVHYLGFVLETGTGGRWLNTTATFDQIRPGTEPDAIRDFGAQFRTNAAAGFAPVGSEQRVNADVTGPQGATGAAVSADGAGNYVIAWRTIGAGGQDVLTARVFNPDGTPQSPEVTIATPPSGFVGPPLVAMAKSGGRFAVTWTAVNSSNGAINAYVSTYNLDGTLRSGPTSVTTSTSTTRNFASSIAADAAGNFVVLINQETQDHFGHWSTPNVKAQRFAANGAANGTIISVASLRLINGTKSVAMADNGIFVVVYDEVTKNGSVVYAQRYTAAGQKSGSLIVVATTSTGLVWNSNVAMNGSGQFAVSYYSRGVGNYVRVYNANGTPTGPAVAVAPGGPEAALALAMDDAGNVTLAWTDARQPASANGGTYVYGNGEMRVQRLAAGATSPSSETIVNTTTQGAQSAAGLAITGSGRFVAVWTGNGPGDDQGVFSQQFQLI